MADAKGTALTPRSRSAPKVVAPRNKVVAPRNKVNVALPFSRIMVDDPMKMRVGDWICLAGLVISVIGFSATIRQLIRTARALEADQATPRANREDADSLASALSEHR